MHLRLQQREIVFCIFLLSCFSSLAEPDPIIRFIENKNQWSDNSLLRAEVPGGFAGIYSDRLKFTLLAPEGFSGKDGKRRDEFENIHSYEHSPHGNSWQVHIYEMNFVGASSSSVVKGLNPFSTNYNYFTGNDRSRWAANVKAYSVVYYESVYEGIDLQVYSKGNNLKYEWIVKENSNPERIRIRYVGLDNIYTENGDMHLVTSAGVSIELKPYAFQRKNGYQVSVACEYALNGNEVSYFFPDGYDECHELIIDPILIFSGYSGSFLDNWGNTATYDSLGNAYSGGMVKNPANMAGFPVTPGAYQVNSGGGKWDVGILKYDSSGSSLLYATYIGGNNTDAPQSLVVNKDNELLILGTTGSDDFPVTNGSSFSGGTDIDPIGDVLYENGTDIFVAKLNSTGSALWATYLGGTQNDGINFISGKLRSTTKVESPLARNYGDQARGDIITDDENFVYIASCTRSSNISFPNGSTSYNGGSMDAIVVKLSPDLSSVVWGKYIGGSNADAAYSIKLYEDKIYASGGSNSVSMSGMNGLHVTNNGNIDGWIQSLTKDGVIIDGTFLGTSSYDQCYFIDINKEGDVYSFGQTQGNYPVQGNVYFNSRGGQFIHKLSGDLKTTIFSTVIGSGGNAPNISPTAFLVNDCNNLFLSGWGGRTNSPAILIEDNVLVNRNFVGGNTFNMPVTADAFQKTTSGSDFYFMVLSADASEFLYGTYFGGSSSATHVDGGTSRFDKQGIVYHAVCAGCGGVSDFPAVNVPEQHQFNRSTNCNNAIFKFDLAQLRARIQTNSEQLDMPGLNKVCIPDKIAFQNKSVGGEIFEWDLGDGTKITKNDTSLILHQYQSIGVYHVKLKVIDTKTCKGTDQTSTMVYVFIRQSVVDNGEAICGGSSYTLNATGGIAYAWLSKDSLFKSSVPAPTLEPAESMVYYVTITEQSGCVVRDSVVVRVVPSIDVKFDYSKTSLCLARPKLQVIDSTKDATDAQMIFDFGDGATSDLSESTHEYAADGTYQVKLVGIREFCTYESQVPIPIYSLTIPNVITPAITEGDNDALIVRMGPPEEQKSTSDFGLRASLIIYNRWGKKLYEDHDYQNNWSGEGLSSGIYYYELTVEGYESCRSWVHVIK